MGAAHEPPNITLTFGQAFCRRLVHELDLLSHRIRQVAGVQSVVTRLDLHGCQRVIIYTLDGVDNAGLLRGMASALREPVEAMSAAADASVVSAPLVATLDSQFARPQNDSVAAKSNPEPDPQQSVERRTIVVRLREFAYGTLAVASVGMAWVGLLVPGIPTVPFVILAAGLAAKSSPALHRRLRESRVFGPIIRDWDTHRAVRPYVKLQAAIATIVIVSITILVASPSPTVYALIGIMAVFSLTMVWLLPVTPEDQPDSVVRQPALCSAVG